MKQQLICFFAVCYLSVKKVLTSMATCSMDSLKPKLSHAIIDSYKYPNKGFFSLKWLQHSKSHKKRQCKHKWTNRRLTTKLTKCCYVNQFRVYQRHRVLPKCTLLKSYEYCVTQYNTEIKDINTYLLEQLQNTPLLIAYPLNALERGKQKYWRRI